MEEHSINELPLLTAEEQRVLGALMEKSKTTPEYYPMTLNGLQTACNQKTSRRPVVNYSESTLVETLDSLRKKGLVSTVVGGGSRVVKYKHKLLDKLSQGALIYIKPLSKGSGQKEVRYIHLLGEFNEADYEQQLSKDAASPSQVKLLEERVASLEEQLSALRMEFDALMDQLR